MTLRVANRAIGARMYCTSQLTWANYAQMNIWVSERALMPVVSQVHGCTCIAHRSALPKRCFRMLRVEVIRN